MRRLQLQLWTMITLRTTHQNGTTPFAELWKHWNFEKPLVQNPSSIPLVPYRKRPTHLGMGQNHSKPMTSSPFITILRGINIMKHHETSWNIPHRFLQVAFDPADSGSGPLGGCQTESGEPYNGKSYWNGRFEGTPILGNLHFYSLMIQYFYSLWSNISIVYDPIFL